MNQLGVPCVSIVGVKESFTPGMYGTLSNVELLTLSTVVCLVGCYDGLGVINELG